MINSTINTLLIANRGEIACRIIKTCKRLNIRTIAVYATPDIHALHVKEADVAYCIGSEKLQDSYLNIEKIITIAKKEQVDAIHPGYGFLSENALFSERCKAENIIFIGPSAQSIRAMAVKDEAKKIMEAAKVPTVPGKLDVQSVAEITEACQNIGFPVILKAACGGGGKGMRIVFDSKEIEEAARQAKQESQNAFGNDSLFVEKYLINARHIEVQIFRDSHGNCVHLFERDCSNQRRHQKVIEETPAIHLSQALKEQMYQSAIQAAHAIDYTGAGTIEFLVSQDHHFYFMEMNTRLQVEHPVTEMTTGLDLVEWQIKVAQGEALPLQQKNIKQIGHAIEARIYSEDPEQHFLPQTGKIKHLFYKDSQNVRLDSGIQRGDSIGIYFDPLLCKLIAWGENRDKAIHLLADALDHFKIIGIKNNISFLQSLLLSHAFAEGLDVQHLERNLSQYLCAAPTLSKEVLAAACLVFILNRNTADNTLWDKKNAFRINLKAQEMLLLEYQSQSIAIQITHTQTSLELSCPLFESIFEISGTVDDNILSYQFENSWRSISYFIENAQLSLIHQGHLYQLNDLAHIDHSTKTEQHDGNIIISPMPGMITKIWKKIGDSVNKGEKLLALEAMKMEHTVAAPKSGKIKNIHFNMGDQVIEGSELIEYDNI
ncbi:ATP-grasp domain-containing protein [Candidatus Berkiella cookevillensis]|uniref:Biotin carboxylase n=1 Tax=Candidatus Berkiella cookevillensis TaxID=437022 RepID=A0A0Q9YSK6_9GAMM|nr:biotin carboxylase N-terminal domain-containing protein [Candidatus Berkiella cookevillensis]MCS5707620.1 ATP-grasp domain-containing protein [Candidatus Berkiella cookevillensis]